jgi:chitin disaccharide deacetylase
MSNRGPVLVNRDASRQPARQPARGSGQPRQAGLLIVNADDWGRDHETTERTLECVLRGAVSSVSAMVFMEASERAAAVARENGVDAGLHLNLTTPYSATGIPARLIESQQRISKYLRGSRLAQTVFHPGLARCFEYVVAAQRDEFLRLYGKEPGRIDGHHHMHLSANVLLGRLLPAGTIARRSFSQQQGEKASAKHLYRRVVDRVLARRHRLTDFFFSLLPLDPPDRLRTILSLANDSIVEVETHPVNPEEHRFLAGGEIFRLAAAVPVASRYAIADGRSARK